jgi:hypothetical protein
MVMVNYIVEGFLFCWQAIMWLTGFSTGAISFLVILSLLCKAADAISAKSQGVTR